MDDVPKHTRRQRDLEKSREYCKVYYEKNSEKIKDGKKKYYEANRDKVLAREKKNYEADPEKKKASSRKWREENPEKALETTKKYRENNRDKMKAYRDKHRFLVIKHYSKGKFECICCGEKRYRTLTIDHINGGGNKHRKEIGKNLPRWLIKSNFPDGFQIPVSYTHLTLPTNREV